MKTESVTLKSAVSPESLAYDIFELLDQKKAADLLLLDLSRVNAYFHYFLLASATSEVHLKSLLREILKNFSQYMPSGGGFRPRDAESGWIIVDFIDLVVHLFLDEQRGFYNLERLWGDAEILRRS